ncbi:MAG TPA: extracellular solute-binding protein [Levilinea sp.]|nr:extracellular solute-binding protein [Levilinea sp.]
MSKIYTRRDFLRYASTISAGAALAACAPLATPTEGNMADDPAPAANEKKFAGTTLTYWSMNYGDIIEWEDMLNGFAAKFKEETGIEVTVDIINWSVAFNTWLTVANGGTHPDCADMYWLHSFAAIGAGIYGPMPITKYQYLYFPDLKERFFEPSLRDVFHNGEFYGVPWRGDIRPMIVRTDFFEEAGIDKAPDTWDEIVEVAKKLTVVDPNGQTSRYGFTFGSALPIQQLMQYYWSAGGAFMTADGKTATIDNEEMRKTLQWAYDLIWTHKVTPPEFMEKSYVPLDAFRTGTVAMIGSVSDSVGNDLERDNPELNEKWGYALPPTGPAKRAAYAGAGYWGVLHGTDKVEQSVQWIGFMARRENMQTVSEYIGRVSPDKIVMQSPYWSEKPWRIVVAETLNYGHPSQQPSPAWAALAGTEPGGVIFDLFYDALVKRDDMEATIKRAQQRMQEEMDKTQL